jgi:two-component sensor histidine kinase
LPDPAPENADGTAEGLRQALADAHHRTRNNLQVVLSLIGLYRRAYPESEGALDAIAGRIRAMDAVQHQLRDGALAPVDVRDYLQRLASALTQTGAPGQATLSVRGETFLIAAKEANALGMVVAEANASDPGAGPTRRAARVAVEIAAEPVRSVTLTGEGVAQSREGPSLRLMQAYAAKGGIELSRAAADAGPTLTLTFGAGQGS